METFLGRITVVLLIAASCTGVFFVQNRLDKLHPEEAFEEFMYIPNGKALKIIALGFDSPLSDVLYLKSLIYWSKNATAISKKHKEAKFKYLFKAMDAVTDLNPYFDTAYLNGGLLVSAANKPEEAKAIFEKGIKIMPKNWWLHMNLAALGLIQLDDKQLAIRHYKLAANCPGASSAVIGAWKNLELEEEGLKDNDDALKRYNMQISLWEETLGEKGNCKELEQYGLNELNELKTERLIYVLEDKYYKYVEEKNFRPTIELLIKDGYIVGDVADYLKDFPYLENDSIIFSETGTPYSLKLIDKKIIVGERKIANSKPEEKAKGREYINFLRTRRLMFNFSLANRKFFAEHNRFPKFEEIFTPKYFPADMLDEHKEFPYLKDDKPFFLSGGMVSSKKLIENDIDLPKKMFKRAVDSYKVKHKSSPEGFDKLIEEGFLKRKPLHPLFDQGYSFNFDFETGQVTENKPFSSGAE